jgi:hypothetical protein
MQDPVCPNIAGGWIRTVRGCCRRIVKLDGWLFIKETTFYIEHNITSAHSQTMMSKQPYRQTTSNHLYSTKFNVIHHTSPVSIRPLTIRLSSIVANGESSSWHFHNRFHTDLFSRWRQMIFCCIGRSSSVSQTTSEQDIQIAATNLTTPATHNVSRRRSCHTRLRLLVQAPFIRWW